MITENKPLTIAQEQKYDITSVLIAKNKMNGEYHSIVNYDILNEDGVVIKQGLLTFTGEKFNTWNTSYRNDKFLYENLIEELNLDTNADDVEEDFQNVIPE